MFYQIIENLLLGFAISAAPGAVFFETIRRTLSKKSTVTSFLLGNFSGMLIIIVFALAGISVLLTDTSLSKFFYGITGLLLTYIGVSSLTAKFSQQTAKEEAKAPNRYSSYVSGLVLAVANPLSIVFWISLTGKFYQEYDSILPILLNATSVVIGALILFILLVLAVKFLRKRINTTILAWLARMSGIIILIYGLLTLSRVVFN